MSDPASARHLPRRFWMLAALFAIAIHAGGVALAFAFTRAEEAERDLGAPAIEIGVELTAARKIETGLPVGPDSEASIASPAMVEQQKVLEQTELPKDAPTETDDPDRVVTPNETKPPKDDDPKPASRNPMRLGKPSPPRRPRRRPLKIRCSPYARCRPRREPAPARNAIW